MIVTETNKTNLQKDLDRLGLHAEKYSLKISPTKTKAMCFNGPQPSYQLEINNIQIEWVKERKYLGIIFDKRLSFNNHIQYLLTKCQKKNKYNAITHNNR